MDLAAIAVVGRTLHVAFTTNPTLAAAGTIFCGVFVQALPRVGQSVFVVVVIVGGVAAAVVDIVHVVAVGNRDVTAAGAVAVIMSIVRGVLAVRRFAFVVVAVVFSVQVSIMNVVDVVLVGDGDVSAFLAVDVVVTQMLGVARCHVRFSCLSSA